MHVFSKNLIGIKKVAFTKNGELKGLWVYGCLVVLSIGLMSLPNPYKTYVAEVMRAGIFSLSLMAFLSRGCSLRPKSRKNAFSSQTKCGVCLR